jgi:hypothetical protein
VWYYVGSIKENFMMNETGFSAEHAEHNMPHVEGADVGSHYEMPEYLAEKLGDAAGREHKRVEFLFNQLLLNHTDQDNLAEGSAAVEELWQLAYNKFRKEEDETPSAQAAEAPFAGWEK